MEFESMNWLQLIWNQYIVVAFFSGWITGVIFANVMPFIKWDLYRAELYCRLLNSLPADDFPQSSAAVYRHEHQHRLAKAATGLLQKQIIYFNPNTGIFHVKP